MPLSLSSTSPSVFDIDGDLSADTPEGADYDLAEDDADDLLVKPSEVVALGAALAKGSAPTVNLYLSSLRQMAERGEITPDTHLNHLLDALGDADLTPARDRGAAALYLGELKRLQRQRSGPFIRGSNRWPEPGVAQALISTYPVRPAGRPEEGWPAALLRWYSRVEAFVDDGLVDHKRLVQLMQLAPGGRTPLGIIANDGRSEPLRDFLDRALRAGTKGKLSKQELTRVVTETGIGLPPVLSLLCDRRRTDPSPLMFYLAGLERAERHGRVPASTLAGVLLTRDELGAFLISRSSPEQARAIRQVLDEAPQQMISEHAGGQIRAALLVDGSAAASSRDRTPRAPHIDPSWEVVDPPRST